MPASPSQLEAIADVGRGTRARTPRWLWIVAATVGVACAAAFVIALASSGEPAANAGHTAGSGAASERTSGVGFAAGLVIGVAAGIGIGVAIARQRRGPAGA